MGMLEWLQLGLDDLMALPGYLLDSGKRIYLPYLLGGLLLAVPAFWFRYRRFAPGDFVRYLFHPRIWGHASARQDYWLFGLNALLKGLFFAPLVLTMVPVAMGFSAGLEEIFGQIRPVSDHQTVVIASFTLLLFLLDDVTRFLLHYLLHKVPFLWDYHKVHHSAKVLTPMTIYRTHPLESYLYACRMGLAQGLAVGLGYYLFGPTLSMVDVLGANLFVFVFNVLGANLRHSHVWLPFGDHLEGIFISPAQHQIHHSDHPDHYDRNLGSALAIWDRLAGTLIKSSQVGRIRFGVGKHFTGHDRLHSLYLEPFSQNWQRFKALRKRRGVTLVEGSKV